MTTRKQKELTEILEQLKDLNKPFFTKREIELAIVKTKLICDKRSITNWFNLLFKLELLEQPTVNQYKIVDSRLKEVV